MKQLTLFIASLLSISLMAQTEGTSLEEYRYLSKGYVYQMEMGLDASKDGYTIQELFTASNGAALVGLFKLNEQKAKAFLVVIENKNEKPSYICFPNRAADDRVKSLYKMDQKKITSSKTKEKYQTVLEEFLFYAVNQGDSPRIVPSKQAMAQTQMKTAKQPLPTNYDTPVQPRQEEFTSKGGDEMSFRTEETPIKSPLVTAKMEVKGGLEYRNAVDAPKPQANTRKKGAVAIKVCVNMDGTVTSAKFTQRGSTTFDRYLKKLALDSAKNTKFTKNDVREECGIILYHFNN